MSRVGTTRAIAAVEEILVYVPPEIEASRKLLEDVTDKIEEEVQKIQVAFSFPPLETLMFSLKFLCFFPRKSVFKSLVFSEFQLIFFSL